MRTAIISDVHANLFALRAVLDDAAGEYDELLCLGDVVGYGAYPNECCELLKERGAQCVVGNHDAAVLGWEIYDEWSPRAVESLDWTRDHLSIPSQLFLEQGSEARLVEPNGGAPFWITHADLEAPFYINYILTVGEAFADFERLHDSPARLGFFGHTHRAVVYSMPLPFEISAPIIQTRLPSGGELTLDEEALYLVNPGSVGQPRDGNPHARYALFNTSTRHIEMRAVAYDVEAARSAILKAGQHIFLGDRLREGR